MNLGQTSVAFHKVEQNLNKLFNWQKLLSNIYQINLQK